MKTLEGLGARLEEGLETIEEKAASPLKATILGIALGLGVIAGGIGTFVLVLALLVNLFA